MISGSNLVVITAGLGGGTRTEATSNFAIIAKEMETLTLSVVTTPF